MYGVTPPDAAIMPLYAFPTIPLGSEAVVMTSFVLPAEEILMLRLAVADFALGKVESFTATATGHVPTALCAGFPVIVPVELPIANPAGRFVAP